MPGTGGAAAASSPDGTFPDWPAAAFDATSVDSALTALYGTTEVTQTDDVVIDLPVFAEAGAMVPIAVSTRLPRVQAIHVLVRENPAPLAVSFAPLPGSDPLVATRVRVERTSDVVVCVRAGRPALRQHRGRRRDRARRLHGAQGARLMRKASYTRSGRRDHVRRCSTRQHS
jgi:sulfur-oxidizing protein SoxY